jgi:hypothetical protein
LAKQLLAIRATGEQWLYALLAIVVDTVTNRQKLDIPALPYEFGVHPGDARCTVLLCLPHQALNRSLSAFMDNGCHLLNFATGEGFYARSDTTRKPDGMDGVPDNQFARGKALGVQTVHFIPRETRHDCHRSSIRYLRFSLLMYSVHRLPSICCDHTLGFK